MNLCRHSSIHRLLTLFSALATLAILASLLPLVAVDWERICDSREREIAAGYQFARALIRERLAAVRLLAEQSVHRADVPASSSATILVVSPGGALLRTSSGRFVPRLASLGERLLSSPLSGVEVDDQGALVAVGTFPGPEGIAVAVLPFTLADAQAIKEATGLESSFFAGQTRVVTTLRDSRGQLAIAAPLPAADWEALQSQAGRLRWTQHPLLAGRVYLEIQVPLYGLDGSLVGAYAIGRSWTDHWALLGRRAWVWLVIVLGSSGLVFLLTLWLRWRLLRPVDRLQETLASMARGRGTAVAPSGLAELDPLIQQINQLAAERATLIRKNERLAEQLTHAQTMAALGQLAAGVAHDLNNPLTTIIGLADIIQTANVDPDTRRDLATIRRQAERSGRIVRGLLSFARRQKADPQWISLNDLISQTLELLAYQARISNIQCESHLDEDLPLTWADASQMQQVLFNLMNNALQAMADAHGRGKLRVESSWLPPTPGAPHGWIAIQVSDDGPGIPADVLPRLFHSYFTTKEPGNGTGLGLAIAASVVQRHSGRIWAENNPEGGACFRVELPVTPEPPQGVVAPPPSAGPMGEPRSILLADSDPQRVSQLARMLRRRGYLLATAGDGLLAQSKMELEAFDLVLCGLQLSRLDGRQLYAWARIHCPEMAGRFVFIAAGDIDGETRAFLQASQALVLWPPFQDDVVAEAVARALSSKGNNSPAPQVSGTKKS